MTYQVWHYSGQDRFQRFSDAAYTGGLTPDFRLVATVEARTLDGAYLRTQHRDAPWTDGPVTLPPEDVAALAAARAADPAVNSSVALQRRSTSVGDILVDADGLAFGVAALGFTQIVP